jgi:hypothetical protein
VIFCSAESGSLPLFHTLLGALRGASDEAVDPSHLHAGDRERRRLSEL